MEWQPWLCVLILPNLGYWEVYFGVRELVKNAWDASDVQGLYRTGYYKEIKCQSN